MSTKAFTIAPQNKYCCYRWILGVLFDCNDSFSSHQMYKKKKFYTLNSTLLRRPTVPHYFTLAFYWTTNSLLSLVLCLPACLLCLEIHSLAFVPNGLWWHFFLWYLCGPLYTFAENEHKRAPLFPFVSFSLCLSHSLILQYINRTKKGCCKKL